MILHETLIFGFIVYSKLVMTANTVQYVLLGTQRIASETVFLPSRLEFSSITANRIWCLELVMVVRTPRLEKMINTGTPSST
jgi:hypothetical protein